MIALSEMKNGQEDDFFAMMSRKEELTTRDGKPYFRVGFRDANREVQFPIWNDAAWSKECCDQWSVGTFYKMRATYRETNYGPQLEIRKIREVNDDDVNDGFDRNAFQASSRFDPREMFDELLSIAEGQIKDQALRKLVTTIYTENENQLLTWAAASRNHHAFIGGFLEHVRNVTKSCIFLAQRYDELYPQMQPPLKTDLVIAGALLHDIGKLRELEQEIDGSHYTSSGKLVGHILQGRDILREANLKTPIDEDSLLRLEHIIISHQRLPEWGSPKPPMTPEALIVHYADDLDAKYFMMFNALQNDTNPGETTSRKNPLGHEVFRGLSDKSSAG